MTGYDAHAILAGLARLADQADRAAETARRGTALIPESARATDPSGTVSVTVDAEGLPTSVSVHDDWADRLSPDGFAAAVTSACRAAEHSRLVEWGDRLADVDPYRPPAAPDATARNRPAPPRPDAGSPTTSTAVLHRRLHDAVRGAPDLASQNTPVIGRAANGRLTVAVTRNGLSGCTADPAWVAHQNGAHLGRAVDDAVRDARTQRRIAAPGGDDVAARTAELRRIADDALATLRSLSTGPARASDQPRRPGVR